MKNVSYTLFDSCDQTPEYTARMHGILALIDGTAVMHATQDIPPVFGAMLSQDSRTAVLR